MALPSLLALAQERERQEAEVALKSQALVAMEEALARPAAQMARQVRVQGYRKQHSPVSSRRYGDEFADLFGQALAQALWALVAE